MEGGTIIRYDLPVAKQEGQQRAMVQVYTAHVWKEGGVFVAQCSEVDIASDGRSEQEALDHLREAMELYFEPPTPTMIPKISSIQVNVGAA